MKKCTKTKKPCFPERVKKVIFKITDLPAEKRKVNDVTVALAEQGLTVDAAEKYLLQQGYEPKTVKAALGLGPIEDAIALYRLRNAELWLRDKSTIRELKKAKEHLEKGLWPKSE